MTELLPCLYPALRGRNKPGCQGETLKDDTKLTLHRKQQERPSSGYGLQGRAVHGGAQGVVRKEEVGSGQP